MITANKIKMPHQLRTPYPNDDGTIPCWQVYHSLKDNPEGVPCPATKCTCRCRLIADNDCLVCPIEDPNGHDCLCGPLSPGIQHCDLSSHAKHHCSCHGDRRRPCHSEKHPCYCNVFGGGPEYCIADSHRCICGTFLCNPEDPQRQCRSGRHTCAHYRFKPSECRAPGCTFTQEQTKEMTYMRTREMLNAIAGIK